MKNNLGCSADFGIFEIGRTIDGMDEKKLCREQKKLADLPKAGIIYNEPSKYPQIEVDLSFVADRFEKIGKAIEAAKSELIRKVSVMDTYADESGKSITVRLVFSQKDRTLTREEVMAVADSIVEKLKGEGIYLKL